MEFSEVINNSDLQLLQWKMSNLEWVITLLCQACFNTLILDLQKCKYEE